MKTRLTRQMEDSVVRVAAWLLFTGSIAALVLRFFRYADIDRMLTGYKLARYTQFPAAFSATILAIVVSFYAVVAQIRQSHRVNKFNQRINVIMHCNSRYDKILEAEPSMVRASAGTAEARQYWRRYWGLKADQFDYYITGLVDRDTMTTWQVSTLRHLILHRISGSGPGGISADQAWEEIGKYQSEASPWFVDMVEHLRRHALTAANLGGALGYVVGMLEKIEPIVASWRHISHEDIMTMAYYRASLTWRLFDFADAEPSDRDALTAELRRLGNGVPVDYPLPRLPIPDPRRPAAP